MSLPSCLSLSLPVSLPMSLSFGLLKCNTSSLVTRFWLRFIVMGSLPNLPVSLLLLNISHSHFSSLANLVPIHYPHFPLLCFNRCSFTFKIVNYNAAKVICWCTGLQVGYKQCLNWAKTPLFPFFAYRYWEKMKLCMIIGIHWLNIYYYYYYCFYWKKVCLQCNRLLQYSPSKYFK